MKKKLLPLALAAAAGLAGINTAQAVHINSDGEGEVLIYPFYTVEGSQDTYISLVNTTNKTKAIKVRFLEAMNSAEVLDFNLYMSPQDHWSAVITRSSDGGAQMITADTSCTVPNFVASSTPDTAAAPVKFRDFLYAADSVNGVARTREGYIEVIEMGELEEDDLGNGQAIAAAALHGADRKPANCAAIANAWKANGAFAADPTDGLESTGQGGGLYGYGVIIDPALGTAAAFDAVALDNFATAGATLHTNPGDTNPSLSQVDTAADIINGATVVSAPADVVGGRPTIDAVSAVMMNSSIANDYVLEQDLNAGTDWVVTFPTKRQYANGGGAPVEPFTSAWSATTSKACEPVLFTYYDREEQDQSPSDLDVSPRPPSGAPISLCYEANVITFEGSNALNGSDRVELDLDLENGFENGWMTANFVGTYATNAREITLAGGVLTTGLPSIGFAVQRYVNNSAGSTAASLANFATTITHKNTKTITTP